MNFFGANTSAEDEVDIADRLVELQDNIQSLQVDKLDCRGTTKGNGTVSNSGILVALFWLSDPIDLEIETLEDLPDCLAEMIDWVGWNCFSWLLFLCNSAEKRQTDRLLFTGELFDEPRPVVAHFSPFDGYRLEKVLAVFGAYDGGDFFGNIDDLEECYRDVSRATNRPLCIRDYADDVELPTEVFVSEAAQMVGLSVLGGCRGSFVSVCDTREDMDMGILNVFHIDELVRCYPETPKKQFDQSEDQSAWAKAIKGFAKNAELKGERIVFVSNLCSDELADPKDVRLPSRHGTPIRLIAKTVPIGRDVRLTVWICDVRSTFLPPSKKKQDLVPIEESK